MNSATPSPILKLFDGGYRLLVPIVPYLARLSPRTHLKDKARGKAPGVMNHEGLWTSLRGWQALEPTLDDLRSWTAMGAGVGIRTGPQPDGTWLLAADADTLDERCAKIIEAQVEGVIGQTPIRIGNAPKALYLIRVAAPPEGQTIPYMSLGFDGGVLEILGRGKQFVAGDSIHPVTLKPYHWSRQLVRFEELPIHPVEAIHALMSACKAALPAAGDVYREGASNRPDNQEALVGDPEMLERAVPLISNVYEVPGRAKFVRMAATFRGAFQNDYERGLELFCEWADKADLSTRPDDSVHEDPAQVYRSIKAPFSAGASLLYEMAEAADASGQFRKADALAAPWFDADVAESQAPTLDELFDESVKSREKSALAWLTLDEAADTALTLSTRPLVKGLLDQGAMSVLYGESNTGKTFVTMDLAYHIATGRPWGGMATTKCVVAYVAAEGGVGARKRAAALRAKYGPCADFHFLLSPVNLLDPKADLVPLGKSLMELKPGFIVLDTFSRVMAGGDENSSTDMGALVRHFDALRALTSAHLMAIHHTGKNLDRGARGHSLLRAATDTEIEVSEGRIRVTKQRDLEKEWTSPFVLQSMVLGIGADGDVVTSAVVDLTKGVSVVPPDKLASAVDAVRVGEWKRDVKSGSSWVGVPVGLALGISSSDVAGRAKIEEILAVLIKDGRLIEEMRWDKHRNARVYVTVSGSIFD
jgi:hypothetical protein